MKKLFLIIICSFSIITTSFAQEDFTDGSGDYPEAYWYFEEASGTRYDQTANNNDLTDNNTVTQSATSKQGSFSAEMDDDNAEYLSITHANLSAAYPLHSGSTTDFTIGGWVRFTKAWDNADTFYWDDDGSNDGITIRVQNNKIRHIWFEATVQKDNYGDNAISTGTWYHVVIRWQGSTDDEVSLFINKTKQADTGTSAAVDESVTTLCLGAQTPNNRYSPVLMDEWFAFDTALTDSQIADIHDYGLDGPGTATFYKKIRKILLKLGVVLGINPYYLR